MRSLDPAAQVCEQGCQAGFERRYVEWLGENVRVNLPKQWLQLGRDCVSIPWASHFSPSIVKSGHFTESRSRIVDEVANWRNIAITLIENCDPSVNELNRLISTVTVHRIDLPSLR